MAIGAAPFLYVCYLALKQRDELQKWNESSEFVLKNRMEDIERLREELKLARVGFGFRDSGPPLKQAEIMDALERTDPKEPLWLAVQSVMEMQLRRELESALAPAQTAEGRAFNNGRAAAVEDLRAMLLQKWAEARV